MLKDRMKAATLLLCLAIVLLYFVSLRLEQQNGESDTGSAAGYSADISARQALSRGGLTEVTI